MRPIYLWFLSFSVFLVSRLDASESSFIFSQIDAGSFFVSILLLILGPLLFLAGFSWLKLKNLLEDIPTSKIRSIAMGLVEINGKVLKEKEILRSPFSDKECVYYKYLIEAYYKDTLDVKKGWEQVKEGKNAVSFYLKDNTGSVLIDPEGSKMLSLHLFSKFGSEYSDLSEKVKAFLKKSFGESFEKSFGDKKLRFTEYGIKTGDDLYILGTAGDNPHFKEVSAKKGVEDIMIQKGNHEKYYLISTHSEKTTLTQMKLKVVACLFGGPLMTIGSLIYILIQLNIL